MTDKKKWLTPLMKQWLVVTGLGLNMANIGALTGFTAILLPQLRVDKLIQVNDHSASWIASIIGISLVVGNLLAPVLMGKLGRRKASFISGTTELACWLGMSMATNVPSLLTARFFQGLATGVNLSLVPIMIGEYTTPTYRGLFSAMMTGLITCFTLLVHVLGSYTTFRTAAIVVACINCISLTILFFTPESPSWLADQGRYEESAKAYRWLRGDSEESELEKMLEARKSRDLVVNSATYNNSNKSVVDYVFRTLRRREFYKPVFIMIHLYAVSVWSGMIFLIVFSVDILRAVAGLTERSDISMHLTILDVQRLFTTALALFLIKRVKRRTILFTTLGINIAALLASIVYTFAKTKFTLPFDHPAIGLILLHITLCSLTIGAIPFPLIISGELFPLEFRSVAGGISSIAFSFNFFVTSKTFIYMMNALGVYGCYALYTAVTIYCTVVVWVYLPETKDRTLQDIEEEFKGKPNSKTSEELGVTVPLNSDNLENT